MATLHKQPQPAKISPPINAPKKQPSQVDTAHSIRSTSGTGQRSKRNTNLQHYPAFRTPQAEQTRSLKSQRQDSSPHLARRSSKLVNAAQRTLSIPGFRKRARPNLSIVIPEQPRARRVHLARSSLDASARYSPVASSPFVNLNVQADEPAQGTGSTKYEIICEPVLHCHESNHGVRNGGQSSSHRQSSRDWQRAGSEGRRSPSHRATRPDRDATSHHRRKPSWPSQKSRQASLNKPLPPAPEEEPEAHEELVEGPSRRVTVVHASASDAGSQPEIEDDLDSASSVLEARAHLERAIESALGIQSGRLSPEQDGASESPEDHSSKCKDAEPCEQTEDDEILEFDANYQGPWPLTAATLSRPFSIFEPGLCFWGDDGASIAESAYAASECSSVEANRSCSTGRTSPDEPPPPVPPRSKKRPLYAEPIDESEVGDDKGSEQAGAPTAETTACGRDTLNEPRKDAVQLETVAHDGASEEGQCEVSDTSHEVETWTADETMPANGTPAAENKSSEEDDLLCATATVAVEDDGINAGDAVFTSSGEVEVPPDSADPQTFEVEKTDDPQPCVPKAWSDRQPSLASAQDYVDPQVSEKDVGEHTESSVARASFARPSSLASALGKIRLAPPRQPRSWAPFGCYADEDEAVVLASIERARDADSFV